MISDSEYTKIPLQTGSEVLQLKQKVHSQLSQLIKLLCVCVPIREEFRAMGKAKNRLQDVWQALKFKILNLAQPHNLNSLWKMLLMILMKMCYSDMSETNSGIEVKNLSVRSHFLFFCV